MVGEWALPEEMADNQPPSNNQILGHVLHRLIEKSLPPQVESAEPELLSSAVKGCILGKTFSGKTTILQSLQKGRIAFIIPLPDSKLTVAAYVYRKSCKSLC